MENSYKILIASYIFIVSCDGSKEWIDCNFTNGYYTCKVYEENGYLKIKGDFLIYDSISKKCIKRKIKLDNTGFIQYNSDYIEFGDGLVLKPNGILEKDNGTIQKNYTCGVLIDKTKEDLQEELDFNLSYQRYKPEIPLNLSKNAMWAGWIDGGNWYDCQLKNGIYFCKIYTDNGYLEKSGQYLLYDGLNKKCVKNKSKVKFDIYTNFTDDGITFRLKDWSLLKPDGEIIFGDGKVLTQKNFYKCGKLIKEGEKKSYE